MEGGRERRRAGDRRERESEREMDGERRGGDENDDVTCAK